VPAALPIGAVEAHERAGAVALEHATLRVEIDARGSVTLVDRVSGVGYPLHLRFEDEGDAGDEYDFSPVAEDAATEAHASLAAPRLLERGPLRARASATYRLELPERLSDDRTHRVGTATLDLEVTFTLVAGAHRLDLDVGVDNRASDHRLRLRVASGRHAEHVWADGHFDVLRRPVRPPAGEGWFQRPVATNHQRRFVAVDDGAHGLAVLNRGLSEYEAIPTPGGVDIAVTLLRCVGWLSRDDLVSRPQGAGPALPTPEAQCHGRHRFELALVPYQGAWWQGPLAHEAERFVAPARVLATGGPTGAAGLALEAPLTLSAYKPSADPGRGAIVRVWNPAPVRVTGRLQAEHPLREVHLVRLDETREAPLVATGGGLDLTLGPSGVMTLELVPGGEEADR
jgi:mannosylglycerate hydrolase